MICNIDYNKHDAGTAVLLNNSLVYVDGHPVCDDTWDWVDANVTCNQLGYQHVSHIFGNSLGGTVELPFSLLQIDCDGSELSLFDCIHLRANKSSECNEKNGAGVQCSYSPQGTYDTRYKSTK